MIKVTAANVQEALAFIGLGLFAFGVWQIFPPACFILTGIVLALPFILSVKGAKQWAS